MTAVIIKNECNIVVKQGREPAENLFKTRAVPISEHWALFSLLSIRFHFWDIVGGDEMYVSTATIGRSQPSLFLQETDLDSHLKIPKLPVNIWV